MEFVFDDKLYIVKLRRQMAQVGGGFDMSNRDIACAKSPSASGRVALRPLCARSLNITVIELPDSRLARMLVEPASCIPVET